MRNWFKFGPYDSRDFGIYISGSGTYNAPEREYKTAIVPGRDGEMLYSERRLSNAELTYPAYIYTDFNDQMAAMRSAFLGLEGYQMLTDSYHMDEYRLAYFEGGTKVNPTRRLDAGRFDLKFICRPERWLYGGMDLLELATLNNPTMQIARPLIRVYGYGSLTVGADNITIASHAYTYVDIDSEIMDCYYGATNCNSLVSFASHEFPVLPAGETKITYSGSITKVEIAPRWWRA